MESCILLDSLTNKMINLDVIKQDIEIEKKNMRMCECCENEISVLLFIPRQKGIWGIFHLCLLCWSGMINPKPIFKFYTVYK